MGRVSLPMVQNRVRHNRLSVRETYAILALVKGAYDQRWFSSGKIDMNKWRSTKMLRG